MGVRRLLPEARFTEIGSAFGVCRCWRKARLEQFPEIRSSLAFGSVSRGGTGFRRKLPETAGGALLGPLLGPPEVRVAAREVKSAKAPFLKIALAFRVYSVLRRPGGVGCCKNGSGQQEDVS